MIFPCHRLSAKPTRRLSADSVFTHQYNSFVMGMKFFCSKYKPGQAISACAHYKTVLT